MAVKRRWMVMLFAIPPLKRKIRLFGPGMCVQPQTYPTANTSYSSTLEQTGGFWHVRWVPQCSSVCGTEQFQFHKSLQQVFPTTEACLVSVGIVPRGALGIGALP